MNLLLFINITIGSFELVSFEFENIQNKLKSA